MELKLPIFFVNGHLRANSKYQESMKQGHKRD